MKPMRHLDEHGRHAPAQSRAAKAMRSDNVVQFRPPAAISHAPAPMGMVDHTGGASGFSKRGPVKVHVSRVVRHKLKSQRTKLSKAAQASKHRALKRQQTILTKKAAAETKKALRREREGFRKAKQVKHAKPMKPLSGLEYERLKHALGEMQRIGLANYEAQYGRTAAQRKRIDEARIREWGR